MILDATGAVTPGAAGALFFRTEPVSIQPDSQPAPAVPKVRSLNFLYHAREEDGCAANTPVPLLVEMVP
jgi:hypothetical protein